MKHILPSHTLKWSKSLPYCLLLFKESTAQDSFITKPVEPPAIPVVCLIPLSFPLPDSRPLDMPLDEKKGKLFSSLISRLDFSLYSYELDFQSPVS